MIVSAYYPKDDYHIVKQVVKLINSSLKDVDSCFFDHLPIKVSNNPHLVKVSVNFPVKNELAPMYKAYEEMFNFDLAFIEGYIQGLKSWHTIP